MEASGLLVPRALTPSRDDQDTSPAWSPDGKQLVFQRHVAGVDAIFTMPVLSDNGVLPKDQRTAKQLYRSKVDAQFPSWSPNGDMIVFDRGPANARELWVMDIAAGKAHPLLSGSRDARYDDSVPVWFTR
jgi:Tol biopolymer transport system component